MPNRYMSALPDMVNVFTMVCKAQFTDYRKMFLEFFFFNMKHSFHKTYSPMSPYILFEVETHFLVSQVIFDDVLAGNFNGWVECHPRS